MDDRFLYDARRAPDPVFADELRQRLRRQDRSAARVRRRAVGWVPALAAVAAAAAVLLFLFPSVRASAQAFLDLFRVRNFAAVRVDPGRIERLQSGSVDLEGLAARVDTLREPGPPQVLADPAAAGSAAGFAVRVPAAPPAGLVIDTVAVRGPAEARLTIDTGRLREVMTSLGIDDLQPPAALDGARIDVRVPAVVSIAYRSPRSIVRLLQARSPEVSLPSGVDLAQLGEIGLRMAGLSAGEARRMARSIDWHTTLLVPVPADAGSFSEVSVSGHRGLLIVTTGAGSPHAGGARRGSILLWSEGEMVYALLGTVDRLTLIQMAESMH